jgi:formate-dependent nitrite reductase membrane component NrfD
LLLFLSGESGGAGYRKVKHADRFAMVLELVLLAAFLGMLGSAAAPITSGTFAPLFWGGLVAAGLVLPLLLDLVGGRVKVLGGLAAVLVLVGGFILRYVIVMARA